MNLAVHRGIKSRQVEVLDDKNVRRFASYVKIKDDDLEKLRKAKTDGDIDTMFSILQANSLFDVNSNLMGTYTSLINELAGKVLDANASRLDDAGKRQARMGEFKPKVAPPPRRKPVTTVKITQRQKPSGTPYKRSKPVAYKKSETTFIKNNFDLSNKQLVTTYNQYFPTRSASSIITKKYRVKRRKKK